MGELENLADQYYKSSKPKKEEGKKRLPNFFHLAAKCPECEDKGITSWLEKKVARDTGHEFLGCRRYNKGTGCTYTYDFDEVLNESMKKLIADHGYGHLLYHEE